MQPDVNITVKPSLLIDALDEIDIQCDADIARFPSPSTPPLPPIKIRIQVGPYTVKECEGDPILECTYTLGSYFPSLPRTIMCTAEDSSGECRSKSANIVLLSETS